MDWQMLNTENCANAETEAINYSGLPLLVSGPRATRNLCQRKSIYVMISSKGWHTLLKRC